MVMCTPGTGHMTRGWGLAGWRRTPLSVLATLELGAATRGTVMASMRTKCGQYNLMIVVVG